MSDPYERNRLLAKSIPGVKKKKPMWCWAASMEWWGRATRRADMEQELIFDTHKKVVEKNGGILQRNLRAVMEIGPWWAEVAIFKAGEELVCTDGSETSCVSACKPINVPLRQLLKTGPVVFGYYHAAPINGSMHSIVVIAPPLKYDGEFTIMEPDTGKITTRSSSKLRAYCDESVLVAAFPKEET